MHDNNLEFTPSSIDITVSVEVRIRARTPGWLRIHKALPKKSDSTEIDGLPITELGRTLFDCLASGVDRRLLEGAIERAAAQSEGESLAPAVIAKLRAGL